MTAARGEIMRGLSMAMTLQNVIRVGVLDDGIVRDGLIIYYDGINNTGFSHKANAKYWTDLSGNENHGIVHGCTWGADELVFYGSLNSWVDCGQQNWPAVTIEAMICPSRLPTVEEDTFSIAGNIEQGGYQIYHGDTNYSLSAMYNGEYVRLRTPQVELGAYHLVQGTADSSEMKLYIDGALAVTEATGYPIEQTKQGTIFILGGNPYQSGPDMTMWPGRMKSFRLYNRALTAAEVAQNYRYDRARFGL